jgi:hypothetical protein
MQLTENIKLLKFLILLKWVPSPYLKQPDSFEGLERSFSTPSDESKQILMEYYYIMNLEPVKIDLLRNVRLFVPFIIEHKVDNIAG